MLILLSYKGLSRIHLGGKSLNSRNSTNPEYDTDDIWAKETFLEKNQGSIK